MKNNFLLAFMLVLLVLAGCTGKGNHSDESIGSSQPKDTLYTAKTVMSIYALQPERALQIIDSAELLGNLTTIKADYLRALVYSRSIESMQYDSAILIAERLMENDKVLADDKLKEEVLEVLLYACRMDQDYVNLIHHSDRGCQYASGGYVRLLAANDIHVSMTESGDPKENAQAERVNCTMKNELLKGRRFRSVAEVRAAVGEAVAFYNNERPHMSIGMMTPVEASNLTFAALSEVSFRATPYSQPLTGINPWSVNHY